MIRKSEADALPAVPVDDGTNEFVAHASRYYCTKGYDILCIDISRFGDVVARYFADPVTNEYKGYMAYSSGWGKIKLENLIQKAAGLQPKINTYCSPWYLECATWHWSEGSSHLARDILNDHIEFFENYAESRKYYSRKMRRWNSLQETLESLVGDEVPEGFFEWMEKTVRVPTAVFDDAGEDFTYTCTECGESWRRGRKYRNKRIIQCPECGKEIRVQNDGFDKPTGIYLFQTCIGDPNRWYYRYMDVHGIWQSGRWSVIVKERNLAIVESGRRLGDLYYREDLGWSDVSHNGLLPGPKAGYIYYDFGGAEDIMTSQQALCLKALAYRGEYVNANKVVIHMEEPCLEYLIKGGYERFAKDVIKDPYMNKVGEGKAVTLAEYLGISRQRCFRLREINGSLIELEWLRYEEKTGKKVSADDLKWFGKKHLLPGNTGGFGKMLSYLKSPTACRHYLEKQSGLMKQGIEFVLSTYSDYINMAIAQDLNLASEIFFKPKNLELAHNECVEFAHEHEMEMKEQGVKEKFPGVPAVLESIQEKYTYESGEFAIVVPGRIMDILNEGRALGHCVDTTDRYFDRIQNHVTYLVFLRRTERINAPWYTLEIEPGGTVRQQRTSGNRQNKEDTEAYMPFIREWQKVVRQRISEEDKLAAARSREIRLSEYKELREKKETVRHGLLAGQLLVDVLEADLVEAI